MTVRQLIKKCAVGSTFIKMLDFQSRMYRFNRVEYLLAPENKKVVETWLNGKVVSWDVLKFEGDIYLEIYVDRK